MFCWLTMPRICLARAGWATTSMPPTKAWPEVGITRVVSMPAVVVLPAPFGPSSPKISPGSTVRSSPSTARRSDPAYTLVSPTVRMTALPAAGLSAVGVGDGGGHGSPATLPEPSAGAPGLVVGPRTTLGGRRPGAGLLGRHPDAAVEPDHLGVQVAVGGDVRHQLAELGRVPQTLGEVDRLGQDACGPRRAAWPAAGCRTGRGRWPAP